VEHEKECLWQLGAVSESVEFEEGWFIKSSIFLHPINIPASHQYSCCVICPAAEAVAR